MGELRMRLQEVHQMHERTTDELRLLHIQNKNLESEKVSPAHCSTTLYMLNVTFQLS